MSQQTDGERKHVATLELTEEPNADEIAFLIDDTLDRKFVDVESNENGSYEIYRRNRPSASGLDPEGESRKLG